MQRLSLSSLVAVAAAGQAPGGLWCPSATDLTVGYGGGHPGEQGWSISGGGAVATKASYNLLGGFVEFDIDVSAVGPGNNAGVSSISPNTSSQGFVQRDFCDGTAGGSPPWCLEVDWIESNGHCGGSTSLHAVKGPGDRGCTSWGCVASYHYNGTTSFHMKIEYGTDGTMTTTRDGQVVGAGNMSPQPDSHTWSVIKSSYENKGAVVYSGLWQGWAPLSDSCGQPGTAPLEASRLSVKNLRIKGSIVQGPTPHACGGDLPAEIVNIV